MKKTLEDELLLALLALLGLTIASWGLNAAHGLDPRWVGLELLGIAFAKVRILVVRHIEAHRATMPIRVAFEAWIFGTAAIVLALS